MRYTAAAIQFDPVLGAAKENLARLVRLNEEAASNGARLIVNPEMSSSAYCFVDRQEIAPYVEPVPGPTTRRLAAIARRFGCVIVCGLPEVDAKTALYYNTAVIVGPNGHIGKYRKVHHYIADATWAVEGNLGFPVWDTPGGYIGIEICMDASYPESSRLLALQGAQVICFPTNWVGSGGCPSERWISAAFENGVYVIAADRSGEERGVQFQGGSCIINPDGRVQSHTTVGDAIVYGEIDLSDAWHRRFDDAGPEDKLHDRRPELYREMLQNTYGWTPSTFQHLYGASGLPEPRESRIGALQFAPEPGAPDRNLDTIAGLIASTELDLLVLPELALSGFPGTHTGETGLHDIDRLAALSQERSTMIVTTVVEETEDRLYNTVVLIGPEDMIATQRKRHLTRDDLGWASPGEEPFRTVDTPIGRLAFIAGYDALSWESIRVPATQGADLICISAALRWPERRRIGETWEWDHWRAKGWESFVALAVANQPGPEYAGNSDIFVPAVKEEDDLQAVASRDETALLVLTLNTDNPYIRQKRGLNWRRLHAYPLLVQQARVPEPALS